MKYMLILSLIVIFQACSPGQDGERGAENATTSANGTSELPVIPVRLTDGFVRHMNELKGKSILVLFQPDCDHCQREATRIQENLEHFSEYQVYFISSASIPEIEQFAVDYKLKEASNFHFGTADVVKIIEQFGSIPTPTLYIYSDSGKLVKKFEGETPIDQILAAM